MAKHLFILIFSICFTELYAQDQWLVTAGLDTVRGKIFLDYRGPYQADAAVVKNGKEKSTYKAHEVRSVRLGKNETYVGIKIDQRYQFAQIDVLGKYYSQYLYADASAGTTPTYTLKLLVDINGKQSKLGNLIPKKRFAQYFEDCADVHNKIMSGELKRKNLSEIFEAYDACRDDMAATVLPTKPVVPSKPAKPATDAAMDDFIAKIKSKGLYQGDLSSMLDDVAQKKSSGQSVPEYLQRAVLEQLGDNEELKSMFNTLMGK